MRAFVLVSVLFAASPVRAVDLAALQRLLEEGAYARAFSAAEADSAEAAGDPAFDYLYGLAALESGGANLAVYALERVLLARPDDNPARMALARAYAQVGELDAAHALLDAVAADGDAAARASAQAARAQLPAPKHRGAWRKAGAVELSLGYDSNVNATTDLEQLPQPPATVLLLDPSAQAQDDTFLRFDAAARVERDVARDGLLFAAVEGYHTANFQESEFNNSLLSTTGGGAYRMARHSALAYASYQRLWVDGAGYLAIVQPGIAWHYTPDGQGLYEAGASYGRNRYDALDVRATDTLVLSAGWRRSFALAWRPQLRLLAYVGDEGAKDAAFEYFGREYVGLQARATLTVAQRHQPYLHLRWQRSDYEGLDPVYGSLRTDRYARVGLGWRYRYAAHRYVGFELEQTQNDSTIALYEFERTRAFASARFEWP